MDSTQILGEFRKQLTQFLDELIEQFPNEGNLVMGRHMVADKIPVSDLMTIFIKDMLPYEALVNSKDEKFFLQHNILFSFMSREDADKLVRNIWYSGLDNDDREVIWRWFKTFIYLIKKYQKSLN